MSKSILVLTLTALLAGCNSSNAPVFECKFPDKTEISTYKDDSITKTVGDITTTYPVTILLDQNNIKTYSYTITYDQDGIYGTSDIQEKIIDGQLYMQWHMKLDGNGNKLLGEPEDNDLGLQPMQLMDICKSI